MLKHSLFATVVAFSTSAMADVPVLSGDYIINVVQNCVALDGSFYQGQGVMNFDPDSSKADNDIFLVTGNPIELQHVKQHGTYSNSKSTLTLDSVTYQATFGKPSKGVASSVSYIGLVANGPGKCGVQGWLTKR